MRRWLCMNSNIWKEEVLIRSNVKCLAYLMTFSNRGYKFRLYCTQTQLIKWNKVLTSHQSLGSVASQVSPSVRKRSSLEPILNRINPAHILTIYVFNVHFSITLTSTPRYTNFPFSFQVFQIILYTYFFLSSLLLNAHLNLSLITRILFDEEYSYEYSYVILCSLLLTCSVWDLISSLSCSQICQSMFIDTTHTHTQSLCIAFSG